MMNRLELNAWKNIKMSYPEKGRTMKKLGRLENDQIIILEDYHLK